MSTREWLNLYFSLSLSLSLSLSNKLQLKIVTWTQVACNLNKSFSLFSFALSHFCFEKLNSLSALQVGVHQKLNLVLFLTLQPQFTHSSNSVTTTTTTVTTTTATTTTASTVKASTTATASTTTTTTIATQVQRTYSCLKWSIIHRLQGQCLVSLKAQMCTPVSELYFCQHLTWSEWKVKTFSPDAHIICQVQVVQSIFFFLSLGPSIPGTWKLLPLIIFLFFFHSFPSFRLFIVPENEEEESESENTPGFFSTARWPVEKEEDAFWGEECKSFDHRLLIWPEGGKVLTAVKERARGRKRSLGLRSLFFSQCRHFQCNWQCEFGTQQVFGCPSGQGKMSLSPFLFSFAGALDWSGTHVPIERARERNTIGLVGRYSDTWPHLGRGKCWIKFAGEERGRDRERKRKRERERAQTRLAPLKGAVSRLVASVDPSQLQQLLSSLDSPSQSLGPWVWFAPLRPVEPSERRIKVTDSLLLFPLSQRRQSLKL